MMAEPKPKRRYRKRRKVDWMMMLSFFVVACFGGVTWLAFFYPAGVEGTAGNIIMVLVGTWQALVVAVVGHWFRGRKEEEKDA